MIDRIGNMTMFQRLQKIYKLYLGNPVFKVCRDNMQVNIQTKVQDHKCIHMYICFIII